MKVITRVNEYLNTDKDIFIESLKHGDCIKVEKDKNFSWNMEIRLQMQK